MGISLSSEVDGKLLIDMENSLLKWFSKNAEGRLNLQSNRKVIALRARIPLGSVIFSHSLLVFILYPFNITVVRLKIERYLLVWK